MATDFGERLRELRTTAGLTLEGLAEKIESTKSYVWELENKPTIRPSAETAYKLAQALNTTIGVLMGEKDPKSFSTEEQVFFRSYQELKPETRKQLLEILKVLKGGDDKKK